MASSDRPIEQAFPRRGNRTAAGDPRFKHQLVALLLGTYLLVLAAFAGHADIGLGMCGCLALGWFSKDNGWLGTRDPVNQLAELWHLRPSADGFGVEGKLDDVHLYVNKIPQSWDHIARGVIEADISIRLATDDDPEFHAGRRFHPRMIVSGKDADLAACWSEDDLDQLAADLDAGLTIGNHLASMQVPLPSTSVVQLERQLVAPVLWVASDLQRFRAHPARSLATAMARDGDRAGVDAFMAANKPLHSARRRASWSGDRLIEALSAHQEGDTAKALRLAATERFPAAWAAWLVQHAGPNQEHVVDVKLAHRATKKLKAVLRPRLELTVAQWEILARRARRGDALDANAWAHLRGTNTARIELFARVPHPLEAERLRQVEDPSLRARVWELSEDASISAVNRRELQKVLATYRKGTGGGLTVADAPEAGAVSVAAKRGQIDLAKR